MRGQRSVRLVRLVRRKKGEKVARSQADTVSWEGVDTDLFEAMRGLRRRFAEERQVPPYVIFNDATLRELARVRPSTLEGLRLIYGVGIKSGLRPEEALDVVQETILAIAKQSLEKRYDPKAGSFKVWLMNMTRWRIGDAFRRRDKILIGAVVPRDQRQHGVAGAHAAEHERLDDRAQLAPHGGRRLGRGARGVGEPDDLGRQLQGEQGVAHAACAAGQVVHRPQNSRDASRRSGPRRARR